MKKLFLLISGLALTACQAHRVNAVRIESQFGNPIRGAEIDMYSINSGHPVYPNLTTSQAGSAPLRETLYVNSSFVISVRNEDRSYVFRSDHFRYEKGGVLVLRLKDQY